MSLAVLAMVPGPAGAQIPAIAGTDADISAENATDIFLGDRFFESFSARLADQFDIRMRHARRFGGGLYVYGLQSPEEEWTPYRAAAQYDPEIALQFSAAEAERALAREENRSPFGPSYKLPPGLGIFLLGDTGLGEARTGADQRREFWTHSISGGMDYRFADALLAGFAVSYSGGAADLGARDYVAESMTWSLFASLGNGGPWHLDGSFNMGTLTLGDDGEEEAAAVHGAVPFLPGTATGDHVWSHVDTGYAFRFGAVEAGPVAEFRHARAHFGSVPGGARTIGHAGHEVDYARFGIGAAASIDVNFDERSSMNIWGRATWQTGFGESVPVMEAMLEDGVTPLVIRGLSPDRSYMRAQLGFTADLGGGAEADLSWRTDLAREDWRGHTLAASIRVRF